MPLLERDHLIEDRFVAVADGEKVPADRPALVPLKRFEAERAALRRRGAPLGVRLGPADNPEAIADDLDRLELVEIEFPKFRDGRGFTIGRILRERYGFKGEIRAVGHVLPDQHAFLLRCGFTTVALPPGHEDPARWTEMLHLVHTAYQAAVTDDQPFSLLRRHIATAE